MFGVQFIYDLTEKNVQGIIFHNLGNLGCYDMGLKSSSILVRGETFGTGTTMDLFKAFGKTPCIVDELYMSAIIRVSSQAKIFRI